MSCEKCTDTGRTCGCYHECCPACCACCGAAEATRDPRVHPMPGDVLRQKRQTRSVVYVSITGRGPDRWPGPSCALYYDLVAAPGGQIETDVARWRRWARGAEVVSAADQRYSDKAQSAPLALKPELASQITGVANRYKPGDASTDCDLTLRLLVEIGLEVVLRGGPAAAELESQLKLHHQARKVVREHGKHGERSR